MKTNGLELDSLPPRLAADFETTGQVQAVAHLL
jgi:hypothetical protein